MKSLVSPNQSTNLASKRASAAPSFSHLRAADREFLHAIGLRRRLSVGESCQAALGERAAILCVLEGRVAECAMQLDQERAHYEAGAVLGARENLLEFKNEQDPRLCAASLAPQVQAIEAAEVLIVPIRELRARCASSPGFAARIYRMISRAMMQHAPIGKGVDPANRELSASLRGLQGSLFLAERAALAGQGTVPAEQQALVRQAFRDLVLAMHRALRQDSGRTSEEREALGREVQLAVLPYLLMTTSSERLYAKPRGYAGDAVSIDGIYANQAQGFGRIGPLLDACFLEEPAAQAVRNRRGLMQEEIQAVLDRSPDRRVEMTSMACGPAREVFDVYASLDDPSRLIVNLIDMDELALEQVMAEAKKRGLQSQLRCHQANLLKLAYGRQSLALEPQDLVYSIGLIDYFEDKQVQRLMSYAHGLLRPGAELILGNFHPSNENRELMDYVLEWRLIHRDEQDFDRLFRASRFASPSTRLRFEAAGVNLFASCRKQQEPSLA